MKNLFSLCVKHFNALSMVSSQTPQKQERQVTPKKTPQKMKDDGDEEYGGSTDVDEKGLRQTILMKVKYQHQQ